MPAVVALAQQALDLIFPARCVGCGRMGAVLCPACVASIQAPRPPLCACCGRSLGSATMLQARLCSACATAGGPDALHGVRAAACYDGAVRQAVRALKYHGRRRLALPLGDLLAHTYATLGWQADLIVPMPLYHTRERERGYNQATLLARRLGTRAGLPVRADVLRRWRATPPQAQLSGVARRVNVTGAFQLASARAGAEIAGKHVLLVDDVTTTGSTLNAAAHALRAAQPAGIWGLAVAQPQQT